MIKNLFFMIGFCLFIFGCAKQMEFEVLDEPNSDIRWWKAYKNDNLNASLQEYFSSDYELKNKALMLEYLDIEKLLLRNYSFSANAKAQTNKNLNNGYKSDNFSAGISASYSLDLLGKKADQKRAKTLEILALLDEINSIKQQNAYKIINILLSQQYLIEYQKLLVSKMQNLAQIYELSKYEYDLGKLSNSELLDDKTKLDNAKISAVYNQLEIKKIKDNLDSLGFVYNGSKVHICDEEFEKHLELNKINKNMILKKFDVLAKNKKVQIKNISYLINQKNMYFDISLNAFLSSSSNQAKNMLEFGLLGGGIGIDFGMLDYANIKDKIKLSKIDYMIAKNEYEDYIKKTLLSTKFLAQNYQLYQQIMSVNNEILKSIQNDFDDGKYKFDLKMISKKDFLRYENALIDAKINHLKAQNELDKAKNDILNALAF